MSERTEYPQLPPLYALTREQLIEVCYRLDATVRRCLSFTDALELRIRTLEESRKRDRVGG